MNRVYKEHNLNKYPTYTRSYKIKYDYLQVV